MSDDLKQNGQHEIQDAIIKADNSGSVLFLKEIAKYFMDFLETDFHKRRNPKRVVKLRSNDNLLTGININKYKTFESFMWKMIYNNFDQAKIKPIQKEQFKSDIPISLVDLIKLQVSKIDKDRIKEITGKLSTEIQSAYVMHKTDFDKAFNLAMDSCSKTIAHDLVLPFVNHLLNPLKSLEMGDEDTIYLMEEELEEVLIKMIEDRINDVLKRLIAGKEVNIHKEINSALAVKDVRDRITSFFENHKVNDVFNELFELDRNKSILDKQEFYFYIGDITFSKIKYPIFYVPFNLVKKDDSFLINFDSQLFVNKKALEYIVQEYNREKGTKGNLKTITERISYISEYGFDAYVNIQAVFDEIVNFFQLEKRIEIKKEEKQISRSLLVKISNSLRVCLFDKSDEALVNDYEEILGQLDDEDNIIANGFKNLIKSFISEEPTAFNGEVEDEWDDSEVADKLVYRSPIPLNSEQRQILSALCKNQCKYITAEGPPGTGKSHTITAIACNAILNNQNVLVLSDKKEALDVVEDKITETMNNVRVDRNFQNPILRLGRSGNTYNQILSNASIDNIKLHYRAVRQDFGELEKNIERHVSSLKEDVETEILFYEKIELSDIQEYLKLEEVYSSSPLIFDLAEVTDIENAVNDLEDIKDLFAKFKTVLMSGKDSPFGTMFYLTMDDFFGIDDFDKFLREIPKLNEIINKLHSFYKDQLNNLIVFNEFHDGDSEIITELLNEYEILRNPIFGYLFNRKKVFVVDDRFQKEFPYAKIEKPHKETKLIKKILSLFNYANELKTDLAKMFLEKIDYNRVIHDCLLNPDYRKRLDSMLFIIGLVDRLKERQKHYSLTIKKSGVDNNLSKSLATNNFNEISESEFDRQLRYLSLRQKIEHAFNNLPQYDYVFQTKSIEDLVTTHMTHVMDKRVIEFYENNRATARTLREIIKKKQKFPRTEFEKLRQTFPCILAGIRDYADYIPLEPEIFDLVIIDEASQVSIAQAFPAFLRAKKIVVFGDRKQFSNVKAAQARTDANRECLSSVRDVFIKYMTSEPSKIARMEKFNIKTSVLEFFEYIVNFHIQLTKHFRGYRELISYSNKHFYQNTLQVMKIRGKPVSDVLKFTFIEHDGKEEPIPNTNMLEINHIASELSRLKEIEANVTVGIITPHTNQQKLLVERINSEKNAEYYFEHFNLKIMTFDTCQGEERDIVFYSMVATDENDRLWGVFIKDLNSVDIEEDSRIKAQRLNVGFSRAKERMHFILSKPLDRFEGAIGDALRHYHWLLENAHKERDISEVDQRSPKEKEVLNWFYQSEFWRENKDDIEFLPQFKIGEYLKQLDKTYKHPGYVVDFLLIYRDRGKRKEHKIIIEYDGFNEHFRDTDLINEYNYQCYYTDEDVYRQKVLMGYGYKFLRINRFNVGKKPVEILNQRIIELINEQSVRRNDFIEDLHANIDAMQNGTKKQCPKCGQIKAIEDFKDINLLSGYGRICNICKFSNRKIDKKIELLEDVISKGKEVEIEYRTKRGSLSDRTIKPLMLNGNMLKAFCTLRKEERTFNINRLKIKRALL